MATRVHHLPRTVETLRQALETAGKLMRKALREFAGSPRTIDALVFNEMLRAAGRHDLLNASQVERWLRYRANRKTTAHDYGVGFANETLILLPAFIADAEALAETLQRLFDERSG